MKTSKIFLVFQILLSIFWLSIFVFPIIHKLPSPTYIVIWVFSSIAMGSFVLSELVGYISKRIENKGDKNKQSNQPV